MSDDSNESGGKEEEEEEEENNQVEDEIKTSGENDQCRGDDKFRCGKTSVFICEIQKCDGNKNCPNGEDEENCPNSDDNDESGDEEPLPEIVDSQTSKTPVVGGIMIFYNLFNISFFHLEDFIAGINFFK